MNSRNNDKTFLTKKWLNYIKSKIINFRKDISNFRDFNYNENLETDLEIEYAEKNEINILIFFSRRRVKFIIEKWNFLISINNESDDSIKKNLNINKLNKKLLTLERTILFLLKILPAYQLYQLKNKNFDFNLESEVEVNENIMKIEERNIQKIKIEPIDDSFGSFDLTVSYLLKNTIFKIEDTLIQNIIKEDCELRKTYLLLINDNTNSIQDDNSFNEEEMDICEIEKKEIEVLNSLYLKIENKDYIDSSSSESDISIDNNFIKIDKSENNNKKVDYNNSFENNLTIDIVNFGNSHMNETFSSSKNDKNSSFDIAFKKFCKLKQNSKLIFINNHNLNNLIKK